MVQNNLRLDCVGVHGQENMWQAVSALDPCSSPWRAHKC